MSTKTIITLLLALALILPIISLAFPLIPRPYTLSVMVEGGRLAVNGESLSGYVYIHFGDIVCIHPVERVLGRVASCDLRDGAGFWMNILRELGIEGKRASEALEVLRSRGTGDIALPTITIRFKLYDEDGDEYVAVFTVSPIRYYMVQGLKWDEIRTRILERPLEFIERGLVVIIGRDHLISQLVRVPRLMELLSLSLYEAGEDPGVLKTASGALAGEPADQLTLSGSPDCEYAGWIPIYNWTTPDPWLTSKIHVEIRNDTISRDRVYQLLWESYLNLFGRYIRCPGSWNLNQVLNRLQFIYGAILGGRSLNDVVDPSSLLAGFVKTNAHLDYYVRTQRWVSIKWNYTCPYPQYLCEPGRRYSWYFTAYKPYMIFLNQDGYPADQINLHVTSLGVRAVLRRTGIAIAGRLIWGEERAVFNISWALIHINSVEFEQQNISAVALLIPAKYYFVGDAFYLKVDLWRQGGYWYATVTPIPFPDYREVEEKSHEHWRIVRYDRAWAPVSCAMWNGTPANDCPQLDALSVLDSVSTFTNFTFHTIYSTNYLNVPTMPTVIDVSEDKSLSGGESLASVAFGVFRDIGLLFAPNIRPSIYVTPLLFLASQVSYADTTFSWSGAVYDLQIFRLTTSHSNPAVTVQKMTFGYSHAFHRTPLLAAYFIYVGEAPGGYED